MNIRPPILYFAIFIAYLWTLEQFYRIVYRYNIFESRANQFLSHSNLKLSDIAKENRI